MFFDEVSLELEGGRGGNGVVAFHREKFVAYGPPDGGDGGNGGSVKLVADTAYNTFRHFAGKRHFKAEDGGNGHKNDMHGKNAEDLLLKVPVGTLIYDDETGDLLMDLKTHGMIFDAAEGGRGGYGNAHFVSSVRQAPKFAELGDIGGRLSVRLELQLVGDVGLLGFPSVGKSTLISHVSAAKPKIGDYPFTTLVPNLGVVNLSEFGGNQQQTFVIADMPGIIEGASEGKGLGDRFLKHISRSAILLYLLDPFAYDGKSIPEQFKILREELEKYKKELLSKEQFVVMNKIDAIPDEDREELKAAFLKEFPEWEGRFRMASGVSGEGLADLMKELWNLVQAQKVALSEASEVAEEEEKEVREVKDVKEYKPEFFVDEQSFEVEKMYDLKPGQLHEPVYERLVSDEAMEVRQLFAVKGKRIQQISRMTNVEQEGAIQRIYDVMDKMGIAGALKRAGAETGDYVKIDMHIFEFHEV